MTMSKTKPLPKDLEDWLVLTAAKAGSLSSIGANAMLEKYGKGAQRSGRAVGAREPTSKKGNVDNFESDVDSLHVIRVGDICINCVLKTVTIRGEVVPLTQKEFQLIEILSLNLGQFVSGFTLLNMLYGGDEKPEIRIVGVFIAKLRKKLAALNDGHHFIETQTGGYGMLNPSTNAVASAA
jgi:DNA-binding response OmpR family regulator